MDKYKVEFNSGELWDNPEKHGSYMLCRIDNGNTILYTEADFDDYAGRIGATAGEVNAMMYADMRKKIVEIAKNHGITEAQLDFEPCKVAGDDSDA